MKTLKTIFFTLILTSSMLLSSCSSNEEPADDCEAVLKNVATALTQLSSTNASNYRENCIKYKDALTTFINSSCFVATNLTQAQRDAYRAALAALNCN